MKIQIRNAKTKQTAFVAPSRIKHLSPGWTVVTNEPKPKLRPGIAVENPPEVAVTDPKEK